MYTWFKLFIFLMIIQIAIGNKEETTSKDDEKLKTFPRKLLARRREEHFSVLKIIANNPKYEHRFQLITIGLTKAFDIINIHKSQLKDANSDKVSKAKMLIIENGCLLMDFIVNFSSNIFLILKKIVKTDPEKNWKEILTLSMDVMDKNQDLLDEITSKEFIFVRDNLEKIMNEEVPIYPYENSVRNILDAMEKSNKEEEEKLKEAKNAKKKKKIKKGPALTGRNEL